MVSNRSIIECLLLNKTGPLTNEQKWGIRFNFTRMNPKAHKSEHRTLVGKLVRHFVVACAKDDVERAVDLKNEVLWSLRFLERYRDHRIDKMTIHWGSIVGFLDGETSVSDNPQIIECIAELMDKGFVFDSEVTKAMSRSLGVFHDI